MLASLYGAMEELSAEESLLKPLAAEVEARIDMLGATITAMGLTNGTSQTLLLAQHAKEARQRHRAAARQAAYHSSSLKAAVAGQGAEVKSAVEDLRHELAARSAAQEQEAMAADRAEALRRAAADAEKQAHRQHKAEAQQQQQRAEGEERHRDLKQGQQGIQASLDQLVARLQRMELKVDQHASLAPRAARASAASTSLPASPAAARKAERIGQDGLNCTGRAQVLWGGTGLGSGGAAEEQAAQGLVLEDSCGWSRAFGGGEAAPPPLQPANSAGWRTFDCPMYGQTPGRCRSR
ncbi:hypothetical protein ABPG75_001453 [Micractinium tetrahymenae]